MENINIPIYRAEVNFDEMDYLDESDFDNNKYVYGCGVSKDGKTIYQEDGSQYAIIQGTASIHFPDMIASDSDRLLPNGEKDLRIFASLQEDGRGGDILSGGYKNKGCFVICDNMCFCTKNINGGKIAELSDSCQTSKITGIKQ